jgi:hypothetical protein
LSGSRTAVCVDKHKLYFHFVGEDALYVNGGIFAHSEKARAFFADTLCALAPQAEICKLEYPPEIGAIIHLMQKDGTLTDEILYHLKHSYEDMRK